MHTINIRNNCGLLQVRYCIWLLEDMTQFPINIFSISVLILTYLFCGNLLHCHAMFLKSTEDFNLVHYFNGYNTGCNRILHMRTLSFLKETLNLLSFWFLQLLIYLHIQHLRIRIRLTLAIPDVYTFTNARIPATTVNTHFPLILSCNVVNSVSSCVWFI